MNDEDMQIAVTEALDRAFQKQVANLFGVYMAAADPEVGIELFIEGFKKALAGLENIEERIDELLSTPAKP